MNTYVSVWWYLAEFLLELGVFRQKLSMKSNHTFYAQYTFFPEIVPCLW